LWDSLVDLQVYPARTLTQNQRMPFGPGDRVHVAALGKGVVLEVRNGGRYLVEIKGRSFVVAGDQLTPPEATRRTRGSTSAIPAAVDSVPVDPRQTILRSLDLHGKTVVEAIDALDAFLNDALLAHATEIRIIHGRSGGKLKAAVHARLATIPSISGFRVDPLNAGTTIVKL
jgi:dsDNA-specific endonuclease/ATPase MutS2